MKVADRLKNFPPCFCRLLARRKYGPPLNTEQIITAAGGLSASLRGSPGYQVAWRTYDRISWMTDWLEVPMVEGFHFMRGCGLDIDDTAAWKRVDDYLSKAPTFRYLRCSQEWVSYYLPLMKNWRQSYGAVTPASQIWPPLRALLIRLNPLLK
jgi:hypothetical protein